MKTTKNTNTEKAKQFEVKFSNMTFVIECYAHYMKSLNTPTWSKNKFTATIKQTGEAIAYGGKKQVKAQMEIINNRPDLFLK